MTSLLPSLPSNIINSPVAVMLKEDDDAMMIACCTVDTDGTFSICFPFQPRQGGDACLHLIESDATAPEELLCCSKLLLCCPYPVVFTPATNLGNRL